jgi:hypothetical protein
VPQIEQVGNYLRVVNRQETQGRYYWIRLSTNGTIQGQENGWEFAPRESGTYYVAVTNENDCSQTSSTISVVLKSVRHRLSTGSPYAEEAGKRFDIAFSLFQTLGNAREVGATSVTFTLRFSGRILYPFPLTQPQIVSTSVDSLLYRSVVLNFPLPLTGASESESTPRNLGNLRLQVTRNNTTATRMYLEDITYLTPTGKRIGGIRTDTAQGFFRMLNPGSLIGNSFDGGIEKAQSDVQASESAMTESTMTESTMTLNLMLKPNPITNNDVTLDYTLSQSATMTAWIQDALGNRTKMLLNNDARAEGEHSETFQLNDIPRGTYFLVMRAYTLRSGQPLSTGRTAIISILR